MRPGFFPNPNVINALCDSVPTVNRWQKSGLNDKWRRFVKGIGLLDFKGLVDFFM